MKVYFSHHQQDYPKNIGDIRLAWYQNGQICVMRNHYKPHQIQKQNILISRINAVCKVVWVNTLSAFKKDISLYATLYKRTYPGLRKRGISSYSIMLMLVHALIRRFQLSDRDSESLIKIIEGLLKDKSLYDLIQLKLLKFVPGAYRLNYCLQNDNILNGLFRKTDAKQISRFSDIVIQTISIIKKAYCLSRAP